MGKGFKMAEALIASAGLIYSGVMGNVNYVKQKHLAEDQADAIRSAEEAQAEADRDAETKRLEALAAEQTGSNRVEASDFGIDSALARRYLDENNKRQAKAQEMLEEEENPFYTRGLV